MEPYFTTAISVEMARDINASAAPWAIQPTSSDDEREWPPPCVIHPGDVVLVLPHINGTRPEKFPTSLDTYIIHPASGRRGWFWSALLCKPE